MDEISPLDEILKKIRLAEKRADADKQRADASEARQGKWVILIGHAILSPKLSLLIRRPGPQICLVLSSSACNNVQVRL